jgi:hypothetical protein
MGGTGGVVRHCSILNGWQLKFLCLKTLLTIPPQPSEDAQPLLLPALSILFPVQYLRAFSLHAQQVSFLGRLIVIIFPQNRPLTGSVTYWFRFSTGCFALFKHSCKYSWCYKSLICISLTNDPSHANSTGFLAFSTLAPKKLIYRWLCTVLCLQLHHQLKA